MAELHERVDFAERLLTHERVDFAERLLTKGGGEGGAHP
jgi:hypothetical protein